MRVLITRPAEDATPLAEAVRARGHEPVIAPLSHIRYQTPEPPPGEATATIFTSRNALRALDDLDWVADLRRRPAYCVGAATAQAARSAGFTHVVAGGGTGAQLGEYIAHMHKPADGPLLYLTGANLAFDMQDALGARGFTVWRRIVYRNELVPALALPMAVGLQKQFFDAIILMSPRVAAHFAALVQHAGLSENASRLRFLCLSDKVATALDPLAAADVEIAAKPTQKALIDLLKPSYSV